MKDFKFLLKKDFLELCRTKKWIIYLVCFSLISVISVLTAKFLPELFNMLFSSTGLDMFEMQATIADSYTQFVANIGETGVLLIAIMFSLILVKEKTSGTGYILQCHGVKDHKVVLSHFVSKLILITASYLVSIVIFVSLNFLIFKEYTGVRGVVSLSYLYLTLVFALALGIFISSISKNNMTSVIVTFGIYFLLTILSAFPYIDIYNPMSTIMMANNIIVNEAYELSDYLINLFVTLGFIVALIGGSIYTYKNKIDNRK